MEKVGAVKMYQDNKRGQVTDELKIKKYKGIGARQEEETWGRREQGHRS